MEMIIFSLVMPLNKALGTNNKAVGQPVQYIYFESGYNEAHWTLATHRDALKTLNTTLPEQITAASSL